MQSSIKENGSTRVMRLKVFTLNCWAIAYLPDFMGQGLDRQLRIEAIARFLAHSDYDIVFLQEVWTKADQKLIKEACKKVLPYATTFHGGVVGTGTMILSKWTILETRFKLFSLNGYKHQVLKGDALAGSGIGMAKLMVGTSEHHLIVNAYISHYHAEYNRENDPYRVDRLTQALEGGDFINITSNDADAVIYCGDFNTEPKDTPHKILTQYYGLQDCHESAAEKLYTCFALENTYRECDGDTNPRAKIIDYIMFKSYFEARVLNIRRPLSHVKVKDKSYSDHEALEATIEFLDVMNTSEALNNTLLKQEIKSELQNELYVSKKWCLLHGFGILLALFLLSTTLTPLLFLLNLIMLAIYLERQSVLKATLQDHFGDCDLDNE